MTVLDIVESFIGEEFANGDGETMKLLEDFKASITVDDELDYVCGVIASIYRREF
jgi:hypothetical protein